LDGNRCARKGLDRRPSRWTHRVGVTWRRARAPTSPGTPSDLAGRWRVSLLSRTAG